jgi:tetrahydromethanopterin S-methyltransferase subunit G
LIPAGVTASAVERALACPASTVLARVDRTTAYAERGHGKHAYIRAVLTGTPVETAIAATDEEDRATCKAIDWDKLCGDLDEIEAEAAFAIDVVARTARRLGHNIGRDYAGAASRLGQPLGESEVPGSADIVGRSRRTGRLTVIDTKSGYQDVTPPGDNGQGRFFAAALHLLTGEDVDFRIAKLKPTGRVWNDEATFTAWDVDVFLDELEEALGRARAMRRALPVAPSVHEGDWCGYCPALDTCPAKTALARTMLETLAPLDVEGAIKAMSDEDAGRAYVLAHDRAAPIVDRVIEALKARAKASPFPLPDGKILRAAPYTKENLNQGALLALAKNMGATDEQIERCYSTAQVAPVRPCAPPKAAKKGRAA